MQVYLAFTPLNAAVPVSDIVQPQQVPRTVRSGSLKGALTHKTALINCLHVNSECVLFF